VEVFACVMLPCMPVVFEVEGLMVVMVVEVMTSWEMLAVDVEVVDVVAVEVVDVVDTLGVDV